jgi:hypothetical protein
MVFTVTFNNISVISWRSALLVEGTGVPAENQQPAASHWQTSSHHVSSTLRLSGIRNQNVSGDCIDNGEDQIETNVQVFVIKLTQRITSLRLDRSVAIRLMTTHLILYNNDVSAPRKVQKCCLSSLKVLCSIIYFFVHSIFFSWHLIIEGGENIRNPRDFTSIVMENLNFISILVK